MEKHVKQLSSRCCNNYGHRLAEYCIDLAFKPAELLLLNGRLLFRTKAGIPQFSIICAERGVSLKCSLTFHFGERFFDKTIIDHLVYRNLGFRFESFLQLLYFRLHCVIRHDAGV